MRPYPHAHWPRVTREEAARLSRCVRRLPPLPAAMLSARAGSLLGAAVAVEPEPLQGCPPLGLLEAVAEPLVAAVIDLPGGSPVRPRIAIELEPRLAACVIDRALGGDAGEAIPEPATALGDAERGILAYVLARVLADASDAHWHLRAIVTTPAALLAAIGDAGSLVWPARVQLGADLGSARAWIPEAVLALPAPAATTPGPLRSLPLTLTATVGRASLAPADLETLRPGDVLVPDACTATSTREGIGGEARLTIRGARRTTWRCTIDTDGDARRLTIAAIERHEEPPMTEGRKTDHNVEVTTSLGAVAGDAPVDLSLEIARFTLPLQEIAALRPGEVLATGRRIGGEVTLRAGDRAIATGELVDVDGEVGVRLLEIASP